MVDLLGAAPEMPTAVYLSSSGPFCGPNNDACMNAGSTNIYMLSITSKGSLPAWQKSPILIDSGEKNMPASRAAISCVNCKCSFYVLQATILQFPSRILKQKQVGSHDAGVQRRLEQFLFPGSLC